ncbi:MAG: SH3 domain-containing protein [Paracoccus sp. (in: a-proteobacteria)]|nr:SH3 domain-containing protein [Paracoccus sp. (in: a-proteobacteria)]
MQPAQARINPQIDSAAAAETETSIELAQSDAPPVQAAPPQPRPETVEAAAAAPVEIRGPVTRLPLPRYVSLKGSEGNVRRGPSLSHRIDWVFRHSGMPLRVVGEYGNWRRVVDRDGAGGWVHYILLSPVRTAIVQQDMVEMRSRPDMNASVVAMIENGVIMRLNQCNPDWCRLSGNGATGWVPKPAIWGVDAEELRD